MVDTCIILLLQYNVLDRKSEFKEEQIFMRWLTPPLPAWLEWMLILATGILFGVVSKAVFAPVEFWSWRTLLAAVIAGIGTIAIAWLSAPGYNPLQPAADLRKKIFASAILAAVTAVVWTAIKR